MEDWQRQRIEKILVDWVTSEKSGSINELITRIEKEAEL